MDMVWPRSIVLVVFDTSESNSRSSIERVAHHHPFVVSINSGDRSWHTISWAALSPFRLGEIPKSWGLVLPIFHITPSSNILKIVSRSTLEHNMLSVRVNKLVSKLPDVSDGISHSRLSIASWAKSTDFGWLKQVDTLALSSWTWCWNSSESWRSFNIFSPRERSSIITLSCVLPFVLMRKTFTLSFAEKGSFVNRDRGDWKIKLLLRALIRAVVFDGPSREEVMSLFRLVSSCLKELLKVFSWD